MIRADFFADKSQFTNVGDGVLDVPQCKNDKIYKKKSRGGKFLPLRVLICVILLSAAISDRRGRRPLQGQIYFCGSQVTASADKL